MYIDTVGKRISALFVLSGLITLSLHSENIYPEILSLNRDDSTFIQVIVDIDRYYKSEITGEVVPPLTLFSYKIGKDDTLFSIAARFNLPYETVAMINGIRSPGDLPPSDTLVIPNQPGMYVPVFPENDLEKLVRSWRSSLPADSIEIIVQSDGRNRNFFYLQGERFHSIERSFFLNTLFRFPLPAGIVTSGYGSRRNPFTHEQHFHHGVDIAAPRGSEVFAAAQGTVLDAGISPVLGNYIVLGHSGNFSTIYGHLQESFIKAGHKVQSGAIIGTVGSTGLSTGPHLHFEIRNSGESWNPSQMLHISEP